ncbi:AAA domain-containing protein [Catenulispora yoronensis]
MIVNLVATAITAEQRVLVVSPDDAAAHEVWRRCEQAVSGLLVRPNSRDEGDNDQTAESGSDQDEERTRQAPESASTGAAGSDEPLASALAAYSDAARRAESLRAAVRAKTAADEEIRVAGRQRARALDAIGIGQGGSMGNGASGVISGSHTPAAYRLQAATDKDLTRLRTRSTKLSQPGRRSDGPRRRFLERLGIVATAESAVTLCLAVGAFAEAEISWRKLRPKGARPGETDLAAGLEAAEEQLRLRGAELVKAKLHSLRGVDEAAAPALAVTCSTTQQLPPEAGAFDLVIIDDANQCSVPAVLPVLFRAKRAVVIGDPLGLPHEQHEQHERYEQHWRGARVCVSRHTRWAPVWRLMTESRRVDRCPIAT